MALVYRVGLASALSVWCPARVLHHQIGIDSLQYLFDNLLSNGGLSVLSALDCCRLSDHYNFIDVISLKRFSR